MKYQSLVVLESIVFESKRNFIIINDETCFCWIEIKINPQTRIVKTSLCSFGVFLPGLTFSKLFAMGKNVDEVIIALLSSFLSFPRSNITVAVKTMTIFKVTFSTSEITRHSAKN